ncbi:NAD-dependent dihydropyrimidine dehydrogenase subunit PreA [Neomoorella glycerini]|uniref:Dihydroorotate dehydrogenase B (NAD(+)), catalytic subunit n=1 Tax=Neomoorella glycerini TaxID=55779 RepID=A0A6I5ZT81_9FIRM|nr:4Fe-4S binding protein [Moorella glycerini]QGP93120.1 NAD-dependent dihydropyrimidine dehydrogenase subunit PreA [Moorella glycerini]
MVSSIDLSVDLAGVRLANPLILSEGPLSGSARLIEKVAEHRVGAIITKSIRQEKAQSPNLYMIKAGRGLLNADWSDMGFKAWCHELRQLQIKVPLITNVATNHVPPREAAEFAAVLQDCGASIVTFSDYEVENLVEVVSRARQRVQVPIMVKLPPFVPNLNRLIQRLEEAGVSAIAAMDAVGPGLLIDIETGAPLLGGPGGSGYLSGPPILPLALHYIAEISRHAKVPVVGVGGVGGYQDVLQMIMAGATAVGLHSAAILQGPGIFDKIASDLEQYLVGKGFQNLGQLRRLLHRRLAEQSEIYDWRASIRQELCNGCGLCLRSCFKGAINEGAHGMVVATEECAGCGVCVTTCPRGAIAPPAR